MPHYCNLCGESGHSEMKCPWYEHDGYREPQLTKEEKELLELDSEVTLD